MTNIELAQDLLEIKMAIHAIADKQNEDSIKTNEVYDRIFKNGMIADNVKARTQLDNILTWKKNITKLVIIIIAGIIVSAVSVLLFTDIIPKQ